MIYVSNKLAQRRGTHRTYSHLLYFKGWAMVELAEHGRRGAASFERSSHTAHTVQVVCEVGGISVTLAICD